jgi:hypothetical protein
MSEQAVTTNITSAVIPIQLFVDLWIFVAIPGPSAQEVRSRAGDPRLHDRRTSSLGRLYEVYSIPAVAISVDRFPESSYRAQVVGMSCVQEHLVSCRDAEPYHQKANNGTEMTTAVKSTSQLGGAEPHPCCTGRLQRGFC